MALGKRLINTGAAAAVCNTDSVQAFGADSAFSSNIALYQFDGDGGVTNNVPDTTTNYNGTASNVTYATGHIGNAGVFNGTSSSLDIESLDLIQNKIESFSFWFKNKFIFGFYDPSSASSSDRRRWFIENTTTGSIKIQVNNDQYNYEQTGITENSDWHHLTVVSDGKIYLDGIQLTNTFNTSYWITGGTNGSSRDTIRIGSSDFIGTASSGFFAGSMDQLRIFDKAISAEDVATLYAETTSTASNTNPFSEGAGVALYTMDYDASEASGYYDGSPTNVDFGVEGKINYGARFNGSSSNIQINQFSGFTNYNFTLSIWIKTTDTTAYITSFRDPMYITLGTGIYSAGTNGMGIYDGTNQYFINNTAMQGINDGDWHHIVMTHDGTNLKGYIDKTLIATVSTGTTTQSSGGTNHNRIGVRADGNTASAYDGDIDQLRLFSKAINQTEVDTLFAEEACVYTSTTDIVNYPTGTTPVAYYKMDNSSEDYSTGGNDGTDTNVEYRFGRFGQAAVFNGSSSYINLNSAVLPASVFSVSFWVNVNSLVNEWVFSQYTGGVTGRFIFNITSTGGFQINVSSTNSLSTTNIPAITIGNWHHVVVVKDGSNGWTLYSDGSSHSTWNSSENIITNQNTILGGDDSVTSNNLDGKLDQVRIYDAALTDSQVTELYNEKPEVDTSNFKAVLYNGTSAEQYISNVGFQPDLVWMKSRNNPYNNTLYDSVRGTGTSKAIYSNEAVAENTYPTINNFVSFDANGFTVGATSHTNNIINKTGDNLVAWNWKGGGEAVSNSSGMGSEISANNKGFSIVKYTGTGSSGTVAHGLTIDGTATKPELSIFKAKNASTNWFVLTDSIDGSADYLTLNSTAAKVDLASGWLPDTANLNFPTSSSLINNSSGTQEMIVYCFASVSGYSKIGIYEGDGTNDYSKEITGLGFDPSFVMVKNVDSSGSNWDIIDSRRGDVKNLYANESYAENANSPTSYGSGKFITDGFEVARGSVSSSVHWNKSGDNYLYMAFK